MARKDKDEVGSSTVDENRPQIKAEGQDVIQVGSVYRQKSGGTTEVIPYFVDLMAATVNFTEIGSSREQQMRTSDFLDTYAQAKDGASSLAEATPEESQSAAEARLKDGKTGAYRADGTIIEAPEDHRA